MDEFKVGDKVSFKQGRGALKGTILAEFDIQRKPEKVYTVQKTDGSTSVLKAARLTKAE